jgi:hypothetical protein
MPKYVKIVISLVLIAAVGGVIWFVRSRPQPPRVETPEQKTTSARETQQALQATLSKIKQSDGDLDGLTDAEEIQYKTDPNKPDTDGDGLLDVDEIKIYKTNPLKADTNNLGHTDGWAVRHQVLLPGGKIDRSKLK